MSTDRELELIEVRVERVFALREGSAIAVVLAHPEKKFLIFVGPAEGLAIERELRGEKADRPSTHDLIDYIFTGFDIQVQKVVVSAIVNSVFCATLVLVQQPAAAGGQTNEVRIDARASDSLVVHLKAKVPLFVTRRVFESVEDATEHLQTLDAGFLAEGEPPEAIDTDEPDEPDEPDETDLEEEEDDDELEP